MQVQLPSKARCLFEPNRYTILYGGRGSAKSQSVARALLLMAAEKPLRVLNCREVQRSIKDSVHQLFTDQIDEMGMGDCFRVLKTHIEGKNGSLFLYSGLSGMTTDSIKSMANIDLCWVEEAQTISKRSWQILVPTIRKPGSRFIITMNPQMETDATWQWFFKRNRKGCVRVEMNWRDNPFFPKELEDERLEHLEFDPDTYGHVWEGENLPAVQGAIWFKEVVVMQKEGRIRNVPRDPLLPVHTVWDLGHADSTSILLVQRLGSEIRVVDFIEGNNRAISHYVDDLNKREGWMWGEDFIPHDGFNKSIQTGKSMEDLLIELRRRPARVPSQTIEAGIKLAREVFPRVYIDETRCAGLIDHLKRYKWATPTNGMDARSPAHDEHSHAGDAFRYLALSESFMVNNTGQGMDAARRSRPRSYKTI